jgi:AraC family transcriptional regulator, regulatory protein of adaptative response / DNA-3-methyladenine glycosylase II
MPEHRRHQQNQLSLPEGRRRELSGYGQSRDPEGGYTWQVEVFGAVVTTGIYCRPGCGAQPLPVNLTSFPTAAAAEAAGYRACLRCRPYRFAQPVGWDDSELVCRAVRLILGGSLDGQGEAALGARLGISARHLRRLFTDHLGVTPDGLARSNRAHFARRMLDDTDLPITQIAFAAGFGSVRQLNRSIRQVFRATPSQLRARRRVRDRLVADGGLVLRLSFRGSLDWPQLAGRLAATHIPGVEFVDGLTYRRTVMIDGDPGVIELMPGEADSLHLLAHLPHWEGLIHIVGRARQSASLDTDMAEPAARLGADPVIGPLLRARPGIRVPGTWDPFETGVLAIIAEHNPGPQAAGLTARLARGLGTAVPGLRQLGLTHTFPPPRGVAAADLTQPAAGLASETAAAVRAFALGVADGMVRLDGSPGLEHLVRSIMAVARVREETAHYIGWRMGERDAFPPSELAAFPPAGLGEPAAGFRPGRAAWRPWRALAAAQLQAATLPGGRDCTSAETRELASSGNLP